MGDHDTKLSVIREAMKKHGLDAVRLRGADWFAWATGGANSIVALSSEAGVAEVLVTREGASVLTNVIEHDRLAQEELSSEWELWAGPWAEPEARERFVKGRAGAGRVASDRPVTGENALPVEMLRAKRRLLPEEIARYRVLGADVAEAMTDTMTLATPTWTERDLAGAAARALWKRGAQPVITLCGGADRVEKYRHPFPTGERLGRRAMLVISGRRHGLAACVSRFVYFAKPSTEQRERHRLTAEVEAAAWRLSRSGARLADIYSGIAAAYAAAGFAGEEANHHQGGVTGYLPREVIAGPATEWTLEQGTALAWNPTLRGAKIEDTVIVGETDVEIITRDPRWPAFELGGRPRPDLLVR